MKYIVSASNSHFWLDDYSCAIFYNKEEAEEWMLIEMEKTTTQMACMWIQDEISINPEIKFYFRITK